MSYRPGEVMTFGQRARLADWAESTGMVVAFDDKSGMRVTRVLCEVIRVLRGMPEAPENEVTAHLGAGTTEREP